MKIKTIRRESSTDSARSDGRRDRVKLKGATFPEERKPGGRKDEIVFLNWGPRFFIFVFQAVIN
jgi:hypothetical protein